MSAQPKDQPVDEQKKFVQRNDVWQLWKDVGTTESFVVFATKLHTFSQAECNRARKDGAKDYNRVLTDNLGKCEYTAIDDGVFGVYRQEIVGEAIREANRRTIQTEEASELQQLDKEGHNAE